MELERAHEILKMMVAWTFYDMGVEDKAPPRIPDDVTLLDMITANDTVAAENKERMANAKPGESNTFNMLVDHRLIAAIYVAMHYDPDHESTIATHGDNAVMVLSRKRLLANAPDEDDD